MNVGGALNFFLVGVCGPDFRSGGLWTDHCLWKGGLLNWKFPNLGACELKISNFGGLWTENFQIWGLESENFLFFLKRGLLNWGYCLKWDPCELRERREKGVFRAAHPRTPFLGQCPPTRVDHVFGIQLHVWLKPFCQRQLSRNPPILHVGQRSDFDWNYPPLHQFSADL